MSLSTKQSVNRAINPWVLHLHKMGLELRCPHCLDLFKRPLLMPCDHLFCDSCIARNEFGSECPICKVLCADRDIRPLTFMENIMGSETDCKKLRGQLRLIFYLFSELGILLYWSRVLLKISFGLSSSKSSSLESARVTGALLLSFLLTSSLPFGSRF
ncbi:hypothetical protein F3Y22_tig00004035pilonHSYRG00044 [Hibiscus syriacus]|uniref:RING-type domain-containing protein n=1 Tax=Hibiscus syriacus TaxID=106335 RepID=A0A6A3CJK8_HIBSY|nr:uncharacterized protein LOC120187179 isoform X1 [Hibiscus syriacus]KAE8728976.1 hypothetical protein F3Y22_tig00004035pilonHSYRG00044 [Hibiscus syriacus]